MVFTSCSFLAFFALFYGLYWLVANRNLKAQNLLLLLASYLFYGWTDWRFLGLLVGVSAFNYYLGLAISATENERRRKWLVWIAMVQGIGGLAFFKYYNFFIDSFNDAFGLFGMDPHLPTLKILVPLGISFFTFRTISYILDVDKGKIEATRDWIVFFNYVSFFPAVISGPIDKGGLFIPQLSKNRRFDYSQTTDGLRQILWGLFKKVVIADNCAMLTNQFFDNYYTYPGSSLLLGAFLYTVQIYADFSGYSDMAIGFSKLLGFNITRNFDYPFFAQNIADFWRRWHMSLTAWLTEYVFTPLSIRFRDYDKAGLILAIVINFTICGIWHGANWTYVLFGFLHGCYFIPLILKGTMNKKKKFDKERLLPTFIEFKNIVLTFTLVLFTFVIFRADSVRQAYQYLRGIFSASLISAPKLPVEGMNPILLLAFIFTFFTIEWIGKHETYAIAGLNQKSSKVLRWSFYYCLLIALFLFAGSEQKFIYFNF
jgi:alginate O-acetyltransferase complex protein AlgI